MRWLTRVPILQLKISFSHHRDLNVKANNDRSWDYTGGVLVQQPAPVPAPVPEPFVPTLGNSMQRNGAANPAVVPQQQYAADMYAPPSAPAPAPAQAQQMPAGPRPPRSGHFGGHTFAPGELNVTGKASQAQHTACGTLLASSLQAAKCWRPSAGQDYEIAHDSIAKAAQAAARGGVAQPAYNPAPMQAQPQYGLCP